MRHRIPVRWLSFLALAAFACSGGSGGGPPTEPPRDGCLSVVGPAGGTVCLGTQVSAVIPAGALAQNTAIAITAVATPADLQAEGAIGQAYRIEPAATALALPTRVTIFVPASALGGRPLSSVTLRRSTAAQALTPAGLELGDIQRSPDGNVSGTTTQFGVFAAALIPPPNNPPTANAGPDQNVLTGATVNLVGSAADPDGDTLTIQWSFVSRPAGSTATIQNAGSLNASFVPDVAGLYVVRLRVEDGRGGVAQDEAQIQVQQSQVNRAPVAHAGPDLSGVVGSPINLDGSASSDPDGDALTYQWSFTSQPAGSAAAIQNATSRFASFTPDVSGTYTVQLTVRDPAGLSSSDTAVFSVAQRNRAPSLALNAPAVVFLNTEVEVVATATDPDGDALTIDFQLIEKPVGSNAALAKLGTSARFTPDLPGTYGVAATASDGSLAAEAAAFVLANPRVAGTYAVHLIADARACQGGTLQESDGNLPVLQPSPDRVILDLPSVSASFVTQAAGTLSGEDFSFNGPVTVKSGDQSFTVQGTISGKIRADGTMNLSFAVNVFGICNITGTVAGHR